MSKIDQNTMNYMPFNKAHAITESIIYVQFHPAFSDELIKNVIEAQNEIDDLPKKEPITGFIAQIVHDAQGQSFKMQTPRTVGQELKKFGPDGSLQWIVRASENVIACHCLEYERWDDFYGRSRNYLNKQFDSILDSDPFMVSVGLKVVDKFVFSKGYEDYTQEGLFENDNPFIATRVRDSGDRWHCHSGWFDGADADNLETLHQLNIDATRAQIEKKPSHITTITHNGVVRVKNVNNEDEMLRLSSIYDSKNNDRLSKFLEMLHKKNKDVLSQLLCDQMKKRINLKAERAG